MFTATYASIQCPGPPAPPEHGSPWAPAGAFARATKAQTTAPDISRMSRLKSVSSRLSSDLRDVGASSGPFSQSRSTLFGNKFSSAWTSISALGQGCSWGFRPSSDGGDRPAPAAVAGKAEPGGADQHHRPGRGLGDGGQKPFIDGAFVNVGIGRANNIDIGAARNRAERPPSANKLKRRSKWDVSGVRCDDEGRNLNGEQAVQRLLGRSGSGDSVPSGSQAVAPHERSDVVADDCGQRGIIFNVSCVALRLQWGDEGTEPVLPNR